MKNRMRIQKALCGNKIKVLILVCAMMVGITGCGKPDISAYAHEEILVEGLTEESFTVTPEELMDMETVTGKAEGETEKAGTETGRGPTLQTFAEHYGKSLEGFSMVRVTASDGYSVLFGPKIWDSHDVILAVSHTEEPLQKNEQPMRIIIPGGNSGYWVRMTVKMEFVK